jgi:hypothetical protein
VLPFVMQFFLAALSALLLSSPAWANRTCMYFNDASALFKCERNVCHVELAVKRGTENNVNCGSGRPIAFISSEDKDIDGLFRELQKKYPDITWASNIEVKLTDSCFLYLQLANLSLEGRTEAVKENIAREKELSLNHCHKELKIVPLSESAAEAKKSEWKWAIWIPQIKLVGSIMGFFAALWLVRFLWRRKFRLFRH